MNLFRVYNVEDYLTQIDTEAELDDYPVVVVMTKKFAEGCAKLMSSSPSVQTNSERFEVECIKLMDVEDQEKFIAKCAGLVLNFAAARVTNSAMIALSHALMEASTLEEVES